MNKILYNMKIGKRITVLIAISLIAVVVLLMTGLFGVISLDSASQHLVDTALERRNLVNQFNTQQQSLLKGVNRMLVAYSLDQDRELINQYYDDTQTNVTDILNIYEKYQANLHNDLSLKDEARNLLLDGSEDYKVMLEDYNVIVENMHHEMLKGLADSMSSQKQLDELLVEARDKATEMSDELDFLMEKALARAEVLTEETEQETVAISITVVVTGVLTVVILLLLAIMIARSITKQLSVLANQADAISNGDLSVKNIKLDGRNEIVDLGKSIEKLNNTYNSLISEMNDTFTGIKDGKLDSRINSDGLNGDFKVIANDINQAVNNITGDYNTISEYLNRYANGDLSMDCPRFPGDKAIIHTSLDVLKENLIDIVNLIRDLTNSIDQGNLSWRTNTINLKGEWKTIGESLNTLVQHTAAPIEDTIDGLNSMSNGDFNIDLNINNYQGDFRRIAEAINTTSQTINIYVEEISEILEELANKNLRAQVTSDFVGSFRPIKVSLEHIIDNLNFIMGDINENSEQLDRGAHSIAMSSQDLAAASTEQESITSNVSHDIRELAEKTTENTKNIENAGEELKSAKKDAEIVQEKMNELLSAMNDIAEASKGVESIIKSIDEVAQSTNLLSLNASVEAARAGEAGKGFAVVANEVGSLAKRSQANAKDSTQLIKVQLEKTEQGLDISKAAAEAVTHIIDLVKKLSTIFAKIVHDSNEQAEILKSVTTGIQQVTEATQQNLNNASTLAATSEEMSSQATTFRNIVSDFKLER